MTNWREYDASLRGCGSLTVWFTEEAIASWKAEPRATRGGQPTYSGITILTALTLRTVFRLALRQTEGLIGSVMRLLGLDLAVPDHSTLSRRAATVEVPRPRASLGSGPLHLLVDSTGLKLCGAGEWLHERHGTRVRRSWRKLHLGVDAGTGRIVAPLLTTKDVDDGSQVGALLDRIGKSLASLTGDGAYDQEGVTASSGSRHPDAAIIVPPRSTAVPSEAAETAPTQRDRHLRAIAEHGRMAWQAASGYTRRARAETAMSRFKRVIGDALRSHADERRATEVRPHRLTRDRGWELSTLSSSIPATTPRMLAFAYSLRDERTRLMVRLLEWMEGSGTLIAAVVFLIAFCIAEYGNYQNGERLQHLCELTGPHDLTLSVDGTPQAEADAICQNAVADDD